MQSVSLELPGLGTQQLDLFQPDTHPKLDALMHLPADHHTDQQVTLPGRRHDPEHRPQGRRGVRPGAVRRLPQRGPDGQAAAARRCTGLNAALGDILVARGDIKGGVSTYDDGAVPANLMVDQLSGSVPWLRSIDSDHPWRSDGLPRFCATEDASCPGDSGAQPRPEELDGGNDTFPLWESCLLRPTFATLYRDWENGAAQFPALGDAPSADPSDPDAPAGTLLLAGTTYTVRRHDLRRRQPPFTAKAVDAVFADSPDRRAVPDHQGGQHPGRLA